MATFMRFGGESGMNIDAVASWDYSEKMTGPRPKAAPPKDAPPLPTPEPEPPGDALTPTMKLTFTDGHVLAVEGEYATALHRYFRSIGSALT